MHQLDALASRYKGGNKRALVSAWRLCAVHALPMPAWAAAAYVAGHDAVDSHSVRSWDELFGPVVRKGSHLRKLREQRLFSMDVWVEVQLRHAAGQSIDDVMFADIGRWLAITLRRKKPIGATTVKGYYRDGKRRAKEIFGSAAEELLAPPK
jgi:hypothetical protein